MVDKNSLPYNKQARKEYEKRNYKRWTVLFKIAEMEDINLYCERHGVPKNTLLRRAIMDYIGKSIAQLTEKLSNNFLKTT